MEQTISTDKNDDSSLSPRFRDFVTVGTGAFFLPMGIWVAMTIESPVLGVFAGVGSVALIVVGALGLRQHRKH